MNSSDTLWQRRPLGADARLRRWLLDRSSLTKRIQSRSRHFRVELLAVRSAPANRDEHRLAGIRARTSCKVRDVALHGDGVPVVFAHSVAGLRELKGPWRLILTLGTRPLGAALFADPRVKRLPLHFRRVRRGSELYESACAVLDIAPPGLWARRSLFVLRGARLLVTEVFLPDILALAP
jgi:chorismate--pyruvate lyase